MQIESVHVAKLHLDPSNARKHETKNLAAIKGSLAKFGQQKPIVIDKDNIVIAGNGTLAAAMELGWSNINVVRSDLLGSEATAFAIADNRTGELAAWDDDVLARTLGSLKIEGFDLESIGFDNDDLSQWLKDPEVVPGADEDEVPEHVEPKTKLGDLYLLGEHRLLCGDSTDILQVEMLMDGAKADMVFTDPPYGIEYDDKTRMSWTRQSSTAKRNNFGQIKNDSTEVGEFVTAILGYFGYCERIFIWGVLNGNGNGNIPPGSFIVWDRKTEAMVDCPFGDFDICWSKNVGWKMIRVLWGGYISKEKGEARLHPTQKPVALAEQFFERWGKPSDLVADLFLGSGTTLIACEKTKRKCYGMELDPHYCDVIVARWEKYTGKEAKCIRTA